MQPQWKEIKNLIYSIHDNYVLPNEIVICGTDKLDLRHVSKI